MIMKPVVLRDGKEGERKTSEVQHDVGIVYGEKTDFILCIMIDEITSEAEKY